MRKAILAWALICACILSGCVPLSVNLQRDDQPISLPVPTARSYEPAVGDSVSGSIENVYLYYLSQDQRRLISSRYTLSVEAGNSAPEKAVQTLLNEPTSSEVRSVFPQGTQLKGLAISGNVAVVDLSIEARNVESEQQLLWMRASLTHTLTQLDDIEYVQMLINGENESLLGLPMGADTAGETDMSSEWALVSSEEERMSDSEASTERIVVAYYPSRDGSFVAPVAKTVEITADDFVTPVVKALTEQPEDCPALRAAFPQSVRSSLRQWEIVENESGRRTLHLAFDSNLIASLEREGLSAWQLYASLTYTLTGFVPNIAGLVVRIGDGQLNRVERDGRQVVFPDGEMSRSLYPDAVGRQVKIYLTCTEGGLIELTRVMDQKSATSPRALLNELFDGPASWEEKAARVFPDGVSIDDILGIRVLDSTAFVNLSANMYRCCQGLTAQQERSLIYSIVNTLTGLERVAAVQFQLEGETVDTLVSDLFLRGPLLRNPGIIVREDWEEAEELDGEEENFIDQ